MSRYSEALGIMKFEVGGLDFSLKPKKGDNLKLLDIQAKAGKDHAKMMKDFVPFMVGLIVREDDLAPEDKEDLEVFVETHVMDFFKEVMVAFRWTTRDKLEEAEQKATADFPVAVN